MYCRAAFIVIVALWSTPSVQSIDCRDDLHIEVMKCFTQSGLSVDAETAADLQTAFESNISSTCSNIEDLKPIMSCAMDITNACIISLGIDPALLPDTKKVTDGISDYLCDQDVEDYDGECFKRIKPTIKKCAKQKALAAVSMSRDYSSKFGTCKYYDAIVECRRQLLGVCSGRTAEISANLFKYSIPAACIGGAQESTPSVQSVDCTDQDALKMEMTKCFTQFGLSVEKDAADVLKAIQANTTYICNNTEALKSGLPCAMGIARNCLIASGQDPALIPDTNKMTDGIDYLCDQEEEDFDAECFQRTHPAIMKCVDPKVKAAVSVSREFSIKFVICTALDAALDCARQQLGVCPRKTREIVVNSLMYFIPAACSGGSPGHDELRR